MASMTREIGENRERIISFLQRLSQREKIIVLEYLADDRAILFMLPDLKDRIREMRRYWLKRESELATAAADE